MRALAPRNAKPLAIFIVAVCVIAGAFSSPVQAQNDLVDGVVAVVEDEVILQSDVDRAVAQYLLQSGATNPTEEQREELEKEALKELISNKLVVVKAAELGITVSFSEVESAVDRTLEENRKAMGGKRRSDGSSKRRTSRSIP